MVMEITRRSFAIGAPAAGVCTFLAIDSSSASNQIDNDNEPTTSVYDGFPSQDPELVRETVATSHFNFKRVRELVEASPALAKANWDWGYGDWESALGAASHMGNRDIATFLIEQGARPNIFSAAMFGQLDVVKALVAASPGVQRIHGPHGITLLSHANAGGKPALEVAKYLETLGDADVGYQTETLTADEKKSYLGVYYFGTGDLDHLEIYEHRRNKALMIKRAGQAFGRTLFYLGLHEFHPAGAPFVRIKFAHEGDQVVELTIRDPEVIVTARIAN